MAECPGVLIEDADGGMRCSRREWCLVAHLQLEGEVEEFREAHRSRSAE